MEPKKNVNLSSENHLPQFLSYYKSLEILPNESEYILFESLLQQDLAISFRLNTLQYLLINLLKGHP